ncbi:MAG: SDR family oxidoreductase, partial [Pseudomonadota bacterium]
MADAEKQSDDGEAAGAARQRETSSSKATRRFSGKTVIVTGAASGIGRATARRFAREGANVVLADRDESAGQAVAKDFKERGRSAQFISCDVSQRLDVLNLMAATLEAFGQVDVLVNNAGVSDETGGFLDLDEATFERIVSVNLKGGFLVAQAVARQMVAQLEDAVPGATPSAGAIINMSSINAALARADRVVYGITKAGLESLTRGAAMALAPHGIRVNAIAPGSVSTPLTDKAYGDDAVRETVLARTPLGRIASTREIASVAAFLASDDASYITGETIVVDGGRTSLHYTMPSDDD